MDVVRPRNRTGCAKRGMEVENRNRRKRVPGLLSSPFVPSTIVVLLLILIANDVYARELVNNLHFPGHYYDEETGLYYNLHRFYDPETGRYLTSDPIGLAGGVNTYSYVLGNPLRWIDPHGLFCTYNFAEHYFSGSGATVDLGAVGLLDDFQGSASVQGSVSGFKQKVTSTAVAKADSLCKDCDKGTKSISFRVHDKDPKGTDVTAEPCLFAVGHSTFFRKADCDVTANCDNRTFSLGCSIGFSIRDWFKDPIDLGFELPGGVPYRINADWSESYWGGGRF